MKNIIVDVTGLPSEDLKLAAGRLIRQLYDLTKAGLRFYVDDGEQMEETAFEDPMQKIARIKGRK